MNENLWGQCKCSVSANENCRESLQCDVVVCMCSNVPSWIEQVVIVITVDISSTNDARVGELCNTTSIEHFLRTSAGPCVLLR